MDPDKLQEQLISLAAIVDMRLNGMISSTDNKEPLSRADNTTEEQEAHMKKTINKTTKKSAKKSKVDTKGKTSKKKARDLEEDEDEDEVDADEDEDEEDDTDEDEDEDESDEDEEDEDESDEDDEDEDSDDDEDESDEDDEDGDEEDEDESDDDDEESDDDDEESDDEDGDEEDEESDDEDGDDEEEEEEEVVSPKLKKGEYTIQKNDYTFEVVEGKNGYKKGDQVEIKRATQASYDKTTVFEVSGVKDSAKRTWVVLSAKRKHLVVPVEFVLNSKGKPAEILEVEAPAKSSKKSAKAEKPAKKGAKVEASTGSNKKVLKLIASIEATLADLKASL